jgi:transposase
MLGPPKPRRLDQPVAVSLEALVPRENFYRHLEAKLDLGFVRDWARELYAERGRPSIDPVVFFRLQVITFFEGIRSERKLIETASLHLAHRWDLGCALDEALPDHSSLTRIRHRPGIEGLRTVLREDRRPLPGSRPRVGQGTLLRRHQGAGQRRPRVARPPVRR